MDEDSVYAGLLVNDAHWAFGTDFDDPLAGIDATIPEGVEPRELAAYCLRLGDDALVLSHRLTEWCSRAPDLEEDVALANIALDLLGQARLLLIRAATADPSLLPTLPEGSPVPPEDALAFFRDAEEFRNRRLVELPNGDFAETVARLLVFSAHRLATFEELLDHPDAVLRAVGEKGVKELAYHRDWSARWFVTLARGTDESRRRLVQGLERIWGYANELDTPVPAAVFAAAGVERPDVPAASGSDPHTEALSQLLAEMQSVARAHPLGVW